jgi:hypothetical protein
VAACEYGSERLDFIKSGKFLDQLSDCQPLKKESALRLELWLR